MAVIWLSLLHYYTNITGFLAYFSIARTSLKLCIFDCIIVCSLMLLLVLQVFNKDILATLVDFRFYWGWIVFYIVFKTITPTKKTLLDAIVILSILTFIEAVLINTVIEPHLLPNFPTFEGGASEWVPEGAFQRPYSFGGSATVGSSLLVTLMALIHPVGWRLLLSVVAVLTFISGTGTIALLVLLFVRYGLFLTKLAFSFVALLVLSGFFVNDLVLQIADRFVAKVGPEYVSFIIELKVTSILSSYETLSWFELIFGHPEGFRGGDFGLLAFALSNGLFGLLVLIAISLYRLNKANRLPLFLILITSLHYPVLFFLPGQMVFGLLLSLEKKDLFEPQRHRRV